MFKCPGCHDYINIVDSKDNKPPRAFDIEDPSKKHKCKKLTAFRKSMQEMPPEDDTEQTETDYIGLIRSLWKRL